jgi:hypothetical protein
METASNLIHAGNSCCGLTKTSESKSMLENDRRSGGESIIVRHPSETREQVHFSCKMLSHFDRLIDVGRRLWREVGSATFSCYWSSPAQSCLGLIRMGLLITIFFQIFLLSKSERPGSYIFSFQEKSGWHMKLDLLILSPHTPCRNHFFEKCPVGKIWRFIAVIMKNFVFWELKARCCCNYKRFERECCFQLQNSFFQRSKGSYSPSWVIQNIKTVLTFYLYHYK